MSGFVTFADPVLEAMIRSAMGKPEGEITFAEAQGVTRMDLTDSLQRQLSEFTPITNLDGLEAFTNLESLDLSQNAVTDISPLAGLTKLTALSLAGNPVTDVAPLAKLTNLKLLILSNCQAQDYSALSNLINLQVLWLDNSTISDVSPLVSLTNLQTLYLDGIIRLDRDAFAIGDPITGEVVLANLSAGPLEILDRPRAGGATATPSVLRFEVGYVEYAPNGAVVRDLITWNVEVGRDVILAPGERFSFPLRLATDEHNPGGATLRTYDIEASLYPAEIRAGDEAIPGVVRFEKRVARVFPRNFEHLRRDPAGRIAEAIAKRSPPHLPLAAALVPPADRGRALAEILRALETTGESAPDQATLVACCVAARILTGRDLPAEPALWLEELRGSPPK